MKMTNEIRTYLAIATQIACSTDDPSDDQLDSIVAAATCVLGMIKRQPRGSTSIDRVTAEIKAKVAALAAEVDLAS